MSTIAFGHVSHGDAVKYSMIKPTLTVDSRVYIDNSARNWLTVRNCLLSPTDLGTFEIVFANEQCQLEFCLRFAEYVS